MYSHRTYALVKFHPFICAQQTLEDFELRQAYTGRGGVPCEFRPLLMQLLPLPVEGQCY